MIERIGEKSAPYYPCSAVKQVISQEYYYYSLVSQKEEGCCLSFFAWVFAPIIWVCNTIHDKITLTTEELEIFEELLEGAFLGGATYLYTRSAGEEKLKKVLSRCDHLYKELSKKWFPNIEGIFFMRVAIVKIKMRVLAALGEEEKIQQERKLLHSLKVPIPEDVEMQIEALLLSRKRPYRYILSGINVFFQLCGALFFKRYAGDGTRTRNFRRDRAVL